ncbi:MAG: stage V sporulation protein AA [Clostridiales bacterium]|nr:stage V sporulation protein AA [Clostridiales bacterium]
MDIYIKPAKKTSITGKTRLTVGDVAEVVAETAVAEKIKKIILTEIRQTGKANYLVSVTDIIQAIQKKYPEAAIHNVGAQDTVVRYAPKPARGNPVLQWLKVAFVTLVLFTGSSTAIMSFHTDAQIPEVFQNYYKIFFGEEKERPLIIEIPYSVGLATGILVFYNHFMGKKMTDDPTPIEVEMALYENDINDTVTDLLSAQKNEDGSDGI